MGVWRFARSRALWLVLVMGLITVAAWVVPAGPALPLRSLKARSVAEPQPQPQPPGSGPLLIDENLTAPKDSVSAARRQHVVQVHRLKRPRPLTFRM